MNRFGLTFLHEVGERDDEWNDKDGEPEDELEQIGHAVRVRDDVPLVVLQMHRDSLVATIPHHYSKNSI